MRVITAEVNDYEQHGEYFVTSFDHEPKALDEGVEDMETQES